MKPKKWLKMSQIFANLNFQSIFGNYFKQDIYYVQKYIKWNAVVPFFWLNLLTFRILEFTYANIYVHDRSFLLQPNILIEDLLHFVGKYHQKPP